MTLHEKYEKETKKLNALLEQKAELETKIQKQQKAVDNLDSMIKQKAYQETDELLVKNNITLAMINEAIKSGDLSALQNALSSTSNKEMAEDLKSNGDISVTEPTTNAFPKTY